MNQLISFWADCKQRRPIIELSAETSMTDDDGIVEMVKCHDCGHIVPASNLTIHQLRGCREAKRRTEQAEPFAIRESAENVEPMDVDSDEENDRKMEAEARPISTLDPLNSRDNSRLPFEATAHRDASVSGRTSTNPISVAELTPPRNRDREYVDLLDGDDDEIQEIWPCPRCTYHNSLSSMICELCSSRRPASHRPADPARRERLIGESHSGGRSGNPDSPMRLMSGGAILGSLVGGAAAYMRGRPMSSGMIQGALSGAVGGAFANELLRAEHLESPDSSPHFVRTVRRRGPNNSSVTTYVSHGAAAMPRGNIGDPVVDQLLQMILAGRGTRQMNIDAMNYEQLLQTFGDGTENRGADERDIRCLPVSTVTDASNLPNDHSDCMICLESFKVGDERKTLPCLHGFHSSCVDKWLRTSASCPVCKHSIRS